MLELGLAGAHQRSNAALALQLARTWLQRRGCQGKAGERDRGPDLTSTPEVSVGCLSCLGLGELKEVLPSTELLGRPVPVAPVFRLTDAMIRGAVWPCQDSPCHRA